MASIFGRRQKASSNKKGPVVSANRNGSEALRTDISENGTNGVNGDPDYHRNGRHSSTFKPQIPPPSNNSSLPSQPKNDANYSTVNKRYTMIIMLH